ncbi:sigma-54-dependent transcriptional regulator [Geomesophilobacter sediminis]|uniref:Sigma-54-dependent Fis family transcriptional regulator n=1 Tax=Geomesophilobacter sediminis TaxID=2798584 RepID=A0A8J7M113_9BACT|nr:sigma-54 dependent transcriptional regulator [Geomesophilobacter sediminis]MBJ6726564.1 sigma-54-dependent Fis family transcriptional regulator [Geomesophilobacter sediminis]
MEAVEAAPEESGALVLVVDDEAVIREGVRRALEKAGIAVETCASGFLALELMQKRSFDLVLSDLKMPGMSGLELLTAIKGLQPDVPVIIITGYSTVDTAVEAMRNGAFDYIPKPFEPAQILEKSRSALAQRSMRLEKATAALPEVREHGLERLIGESPEMQKVYKRILQVAPTDSTVLITGESGTGKELVARAIHGNSGRRKRPFVAVDCTSLAENLLESELFGHVKGSFTGAIQTKTGLFKVADGGTLFLDEIANISLTTQAKLLRVLQQREVTPIGGTAPQPIDIRLVAATNRNLRTMVSEGTFREDLFFRLNIIPIDLPPLRQRKGDKPILIRHFLKHFSEEMGKELRGIAPDALSLLDNYPFPGNVRELQSTIERAVVLCAGDLVESHDLELQTAEGRENQDLSMHVPLSVEELKETKRLIRESAVEPIEKAFALQALERNNWNVTRAAEETGMQRPNFQALVKKLGISIKGQRCS